jgi:murein DD-endopeptidase MepM/ murein hydrolase activator NlpD
MVRNLFLERLAALLVTVVFCGTGLAGCVSDGPRTQLDWYPQADAHHRVAEYAPPRRVHTKPVQVASLDCPVPRAKPSTPGWYASTAAPPPLASVPANYAPDTASIAFAWPLTGPVVADYGSTVSGERNAGIDIAVPFGTPIRAAAAGQISYAGNELRGYGNLVLIKHDDGYVTAYAHAERIVVNRGDMVQKGQIIGYAGQTGDVTSPQLHFEIRKGVTPINPRTLLVASRAS